MKFKVGDWVKVLPGATIPHYPKRHTVIKTGDCGQITSIDIKNDYHYLNNDSFEWYSSELELYPAASTSLWKLLEKKTNV